MQWKFTAGGLLLALLAATVPAQAQQAAGWQSCAAIGSDKERLACFDAWAGRQAPPPAAAASASTPAATTATVAIAPGNRDEEQGCHDPQASELSRFWELERTTSCGTFGIRSYRPISLSVIASDSVNHQPTSGNPANNATADAPYRTTETRIQLSVRSKLGEGMLSGPGPLQDSLWFGYTQQSYWQLFTGDLSRPFRVTDHEPEVFYVYPFAQPLAGGWALRYGGVGIVHQSNGQSLPLSRSWNRVYLMAGAEHAGGLSLQGRLWKRMSEDPATDDNPEISDYVGRGELLATWTTGGGQLLSFTWRTTLKRMDRGSARLQWMIPVKSPFTGSHFGSLQWHTQLFTGYGDSLLDYNRRRTVLSLGLSLFDW
ncbi:phospholipase A [Ramlibacter sp. XY19]|uniref:phospholipase A n=1 Tax=Ramlibacter paludis TaxID=2908000 RepID=UPI0023DB3E77|nr:phospholipase A [Ramlibacter paludis]MCG2592336.1 phospholipase A [Ramlibacter paludis]